MCVGALVEELADFCTCDFCVCVWLKFILQDCHHQFNALLHIFCHLYEYD